MLKKRRITIDISIASIFWILVVIASVFFLAITYKILILLFASLIISFSISPLVQKLENKRIPRALSSIVILIAIIAIFVFAISTLISPIIAQTQQLIQRLPDLANKVLPYQLDFNDFSSQFSSVPGKFVNIALDTMTGVISVLAVVVMSFYLLQERSKIQSHLQFWFAEKGETWYKVITELEKQIGNWLRGELILMLIIGILAYLGFTIIGIPYVLPLSLIAGLLEIIPNIGPIVAAIPAAIVGFSISPTMGIFAILVSLLIHQLEGNLITPTVMRHAAGLNPIVTILAIMIGLKIGGPLMSILAIPLVLSVRVILTHLKLNENTNIPEIH